MVAWEAQRATEAAACPGCWVDFRVHSGVGDAPDVTGPGPGSVVHQVVGLTAGRVAGQLMLADDRAGERVAGLGVRVVARLSGRAIGRAGDVSRREPRLGRDIHQLRAEWVGGWTG